MRSNQLCAYNFNTCVCVLVRAVRHFSSSFTIYLFYFFYLLIEIKTQRKCILVFPFLICSYMCIIVWCHLSDSFLSKNQITLLGLSCYIYTSHFVQFFVSNLMSMLVLNYVIAGLNMIFGRIITDAFFWCKMSIGLWRLFATFFLVVCIRSRVLNYASRKPEKNLKN